MLSGGLQCTSPHREPRTSQILPGITPFSSLFLLFPCAVSLGLSLSFWMPCSRYLSSSFLSLSTFLHLFPPSSLSFFDSRFLSSLCFSAPTTALRSPPETCGKQGEEKHMKKNCEKVAVYWMEKTQTCRRLIRNSQWGVFGMKMVLYIMSEVRYYYIMTHTRTVKVLLHFVHIVLSTSN